MLGFMDYVQNAFFSATKWNKENSYGSLTTTARDLLDFETPRGLRLNLSSLPSPNFATSYSLGGIGPIDGSISYLYSSLALNISCKSNAIPLQSLIRGYRQLAELRAPDLPSSWEIWQEGKRIDSPDTLLYGHLHLPTSYLSALYLRHLTSTMLLKISAVSSSSLKAGGTILALISHDTGKHSTDYLYSTDSALLGVRTLYNFGPDPRDDPPSSFIGNSTNASESPQNIINSNLNGRFSAGAELYYGLLNKSGGMSTGIRFATLPSHTGFPYTMTCTLNPLMGNLSTTYAVKAGPNLALCSCFEFNVYSYESELQLGMELWRHKQNQESIRSDPIEELEWAYRKIKLAAWPEDVSTPKDTDSDPIAGVLKARMTQDWHIALLWEGRIKDLLYSFGAVIDFKKRDQIFRGVGLELQYSS